MLPLTCRALSSAQAHTVDEWIELDQVALAAAILTDTVAAAAV